MKKVLTTLFLSSLFITSYAQWIDGGTKITTTQNVGIGTTSPDFKLDILGNMRLTIPSSSNPIYGMDISAKSFVSPTNAANSYYLRMRDIGSGESAPDVFIVKGNRNIGIGTSSPTQRLDVSGNIKADGAYINGIVYTNEVKVEATKWSDFVFDKDYKLPTLQEVENHINEHKHLPDIPSEAEVKENGVSLGEMQAKLLQKIEELTLYTIELNKTVKEQGEKIQKLEAERSINE